MTYDEYRDRIWEYMRVAYRSAFDPFLPSWVRSLWRSFANSIRWNWRDPNRLAAYMDYWYRRALDDAEEIASRWGWETRWSPWQRMVYYSVYEIAMWARHQVRYAAEDYFRQQLERGYEFERRYPLI